MYKRTSIINVPLLSMLVLSLALHGAVLYNNGIYTPPQPTMELGQTVVHLTLVPSIAHQAANPKPHEEPTAEPEPDVDQTSQSALPAAPTVTPLPDPKPTTKKSSETETETKTEADAIDSPEQLASLQEDKGVTSVAVLSGLFRPPYPRISRQRGETGTVTLSMEILSNGSVGQIKIIQSSAHARLDEAAFKAAQKTMFIPATRFGKPIKSNTELTFTFRLTDD